ncbi:MAG TPA: DNA glycosylase [Thermoplasmata archaeon]
MRCEMKFETVISPLDLDLTLACGQTFRWRRLEGSWLGVLGSEVIRLRQEGRTLTIEAEPGRDDIVALVEEHLRARDDIRAVQRKLSSDRVLSSGMRDLKGLRIVKLDEWESVVSFALATYANIPRITKMIETLCSKYGERLPGGFRAFPSQRQLRKASINDLADCGLGYRAKYLHQLCRYLGPGEIARMKSLPYDELREQLIELPGVGEKVADCVSLFGFGRLEAFPIDVWIERAMGRLYGEKGNYRKLRSFASDRFGAYAGYAQEYLYYNERTISGRGSCMFSEQ